MREVAIIGAGELGGAVAHRLARLGIAEMVRLIDDRGRLAEGKALDIAQAAAVERFATRLAGTTNLDAAASADVVVIADRAGAGEWEGDDGLAVLRRVRQMINQPVVMCAGARQRELVERGVRELRYGARQLFGSAPEAFAAAARAIVALEGGASGRDVALLVLGDPPRSIVLPWEEATIAGIGGQRLLSETTRRRVLARLPALWPPGPYALAAAAAKLLDAVAGRSRQTACAFVGPDDRFGVRARTTALPVRLGAGGVADVIVPELNAHDRVALENAMLL